VSVEPATLRALAPSKINLGLFLGPVREPDGRHELVTIMQSISLADELTLGPAPAGRVGDELVCPGVPGPPEQNLAARALREFRARTGWQAPPLRLTVEKRIPLAAGLAGGSADAAAALRLARAASGLGDEQLLLEIAAGLGADVPAQVSPGRWLASGAGERLERLPEPAVPFGVLVLPAPFELSTAEVYAEADRLGLARERSELRRCHEELFSALGRGAPLPAATELLHNDLQRAAVSLRGEIAETLRALAGAGAAPALISGSGPTALGLFARPREEGVALAQLAAETLAEREPAAAVAVPVGASFGEPRPVVPDPAGAA
jgi:4-diphosphocytidyl-2-C-methyl-D-erythritol kinase